MSSPAHSLSIAVAAPAMGPRVEQHYLRRAALRQTIAGPCYASRDLTIDASPGSSKNSCATGFNFLCVPSPAAAFHVETKTERSMGRPGICLLAFAHQLGSGIVGPYSISFPLAEDPVEWTSWQGA